MDLDKETTDLYNQILAEPSPFVQNEVKQAEESPGRRIGRLLGKGASFGLAQRDIEPSGFLEHLAELSGSIPSTVAASAIATPAVGIGLKAAKLAPYIRGPVMNQLASSVAIGTGIGTGKAIQTGDLKQIPIEAATWAGMDLAGQAALKLGAKAMGKNISVVDKAKGTSVTIPTIEVKEPVSVIPKAPKDFSVGIPRDAARQAREYSVGQPSSPAESTVLAKKEQISAAQGRDPSQFGVGSPTRVQQPADIQAGTPQQFGVGIRALKHKTVGPDGITKQAESGTGLLDQIEETGRMADTARGLLAEMKAKQQLDELALAKNLQADQQAAEIDSVLTQLPSIRNSLMPPLEIRPPLSIKHELTPAEMPQARFVREDIPTAGGDGDTLWHDQPSLSDFTLGPFDPKDDALTIQKKLLKMEIDPVSGIKRMTPMDSETQQAIDIIKTSPRELEPPLDPFQIDGVSKPAVRNKLDVTTKQEPLLTSNLVKKSDKEIEAIVAAADPPAPVKFFTVNNTSLSEKTRAILNRHQFSAEEVGEMESLVKAKLDIAKVPEKSAEYGRRKALLYKEEIQKRRPC